MRHVEIYDTTLRDGSQGEGVNFSLHDKLLIAERLDSLGFDYIEGGYPLSNEKDAEFFQRVAERPLEHARVCAFGMTRRRGMKAEDDPGMKALIASRAPVVTIVGKTSDFHVREVLSVSLEENLAMIGDTIRCLCAAGREVIYDAEHFFDGSKLNDAYAMQTIKTAVAAGAKMVVLCDTNGAFVIDADALAHQLVEPDKPAWRAIVKTFGKTVLNPDRTLNRQALGTLVFRNRASLRRLEHIIHPRVAREQARLTKSAVRNDPQVVVIYDVPLLYEAGIDTRVDKVLVVTADRDTQIARLKKRNGLSRSEAIRRIRNQWPLRNKVAAADYVLDGTTPRPRLLAQVRRLYREFAERA